MVTLYKIHLNGDFVAVSEQRESLDNFDVRTAPKARKGATSVVAGQRRTGDTPKAEA